VGKFAVFSERPKAKSVSASGGFTPALLIRGSAHGPRCGLCPQTPIIGASHLYLGGLQLSSADALCGAVRYKG